MDKKIKFIPIFLAVASSCLLCSCSSSSDDVPKSTTAVEYKSETTTETATETPFEYTGETAIETAIEETSTAPLPLIPAYSISETSEDIPGYELINKAKQEALERLKEVSAYSPHDIYVSKVYYKIKYSYYQTDANSVVEFYIDNEPNPRVAEIWLEDLETWNNEYGDGRPFPKNKHELHAYECGLRDLGLTDDQVTSWEVIDKRPSGEPCNSPYESIDTWTCRFTTETDEFVIEVPVHFAPT